MRFALCALLLAATAYGQPHILRVQLQNAAITPVTAQFLTRSIEQAEDEKAEALLIVLDTPGGLVDSTRDIVKSILASSVPVVVWVAPSGARAASAGVFITISAHVAAMAPGTNIGAAHPVQIGGFPGSPEPQPASKEASKSPMEDKILNDTVSWARSLAELRNRNVEWLERAVRQSISAPASEAAASNVVDFLAATEPELLRKLDGRTVSLPTGPKTLRTQGIQVRTREMWWGERVMATIANPTVAFLLLLFGFYGVLFELYTPGWGIGGTVGIVCLVLGFSALAVLPINSIGLVLLLLGLGLLVAEAFVTSFGLLSLAGAACLILGGMMLVDSPAGFLRISLRVLVPVALATAAITFFLVRNILTTGKIPPQTGGEALAGRPALADAEFIAARGRYSGFVRLHGEIWTAVSDTPVPGGARVIVRARDGLVLNVEPAPYEPHKQNAPRS